ncbi:Regulator of chromosome condensation 1/beta-lactamase-inhibitor protein II [Trinorchestia longiramus]|nr:Regulator of chromosome condensation 1/beta-lactamase-inhibitor protein II [Trinorchestia longiramus]
MTSITLCRYPSEVMTSITLCRYPVPGRGEDPPCRGEDPPCGGEDPPCGGEDPPCEGLGVTAHVTSSGKLYIGEYDGVNRGSLQQVFFDGFVKDVVIFKGYVVFLNAEGYVYLRALGEGSIEARLRRDGPSPRDLNKQETSKSFKKILEESVSEREPSKLKISVTNSAAGVDTVKTDSKEYKVEQNACSSSNACNSVCKNLFENYYIDDATPSVVVTSTKNDLDAESAESKENSVFNAAKIQMNLLYTPSQATEFCLDEISSAERGLDSLVTQSSSLIEKDKELDSPGKSSDSYDESPAGKSTPYSSQDSTTDLSIRKLYLYQPQVICPHGVPSSQCRILVTSIAAGANHLLFLSTKNEIWQENADNFLSAVQESDNCQGISEYINNNRPDMQQPLVTSEFSRSEEKEGKGDGDTSSRLSISPASSFIDPIRLSNPVRIIPSRINLPSDKKVLQIEAGPHFSVALLEDADFNEDDREECDENETELIISGDPVLCEACVALDVQSSSELFRAGVQSPSPNSLSKSVVSNTTDVDNVDAPNLLSVEAVKANSLTPEFCVVDLDKEHIENSAQMEAEDNVSFDLITNADMAKQFISKQLSWMTAPTLEDVQSLGDVSAETSPTRVLAAEASGPLSSSAVVSNISDNISDHDELSQFSDMRSNVRYSIDAATDIITKNVAHAASSAAFAANSAAVLVASSVKNVSHKVGYITKQFSRTDLEGLHNAENPSNLEDEFKGTTRQDSGATCSTPISLDSSDSVTEFDSTILKPSQEVPETSSLDSEPLDNGSKVKNLPPSSKKKSHVRSSSAVLVVDRKTSGTLENDVLVPLSPEKRGGSAECISSSRANTSTNTDSLGAALESLNHSDIFANIGNSSSFFESIGRTSLNNIRLGNLSSGRHDSCRNRHAKQNSNFDRAGSYNKKKNKDGCSVGPWHPTTWGSPEKCCKILRRQSRGRGLDDDVRLQLLVQQSGRISSSRVVVWGALTPHLEVPTPWVVQALCGQGVTKVACGSTYVAALTVHGQILVWGDTSLTPEKAQPQLPKAGKLPQALQGKAVPSPGPISQPAAYSLQFSPIGSDDDDFFDYPLVHNLVENPSVLFQDGGHENAAQEKDSIEKNNPDSIKELKSNNQASKNTKFPDSKEGSSKNPNVNLSTSSDLSTSSLEKDALPKKMEDVSSDVKSSRGRPQFEEATPLLASTAPNPDPATDPRPRSHSRPVPGSFITKRVREGGEGPKGGVRRGRDIAAGGTSTLVATSVEGGVFVVQIGRRDHGGPGGPYSMSPT